MKIIHTADWHIGQTFFGYDRTEEHQAFLDWLIDQIRILEIDALLIAGDVFDVANPSAQAQKQFYRFLRTATSVRPGLQIVVIAGNHDSATRLETPIPLLEEMNIHIRGIIQRDEKGDIDTDDLIVELKDAKGIRQAWCMAVPYLRQGDYPPVESKENTYAEGVKNMYETIYRRIQELKSPQEAVIAMGHLQATGCHMAGDDASERMLIGGIEGISPDTFNQGITYTALGHIHREQWVGKGNSIRYAGSPLPMSFQEETYRHGVILLEIENGQLKTQEKLAFTPLVGLLRLPKDAKPLEKVLQELSLLPRNCPEKPAPYLEVRVLLTEPEPSLRHQVEEVLEDKQARLTRIIPFYLGCETETEEETWTTEQLLDPLDMVKLVYKQKYSTDFPENLTTLFIEAMQESYQKTGNKS